MIILGTYCVSNITNEIINIVKELVRGVFHSFYCVIKFWFFFIFCLSFENYLYFENNFSKVILKLFIVIKLFILIKLFFYIFSPIVFYLNKYN